MEIEEYKKLSEEEANSFWHMGRREILNEAIGRQFSSVDSLDICDIGCGTGGNMAFLGKWGKVTGVDFSGEALQFAKFFSFKELVRVDVLKLPFGEASFHLVTALDMIEHVQDDNAAIREAHRILKPGAYFLITVPAFMCLWGRHDVVVHHQRRYRRRVLCQQLRRAGFTIIESSYFMTLGVVDRLAQNLKDVLVPPSVDTRRVERHIKSFSPAVDSFLLWVIRIEKYLLRLVRLPFGTSILIMARKPSTSPYVSR